MYAVSDSVRTLNGDQFHHMSYSFWVGFTVYAKYVKTNGRVDNGTMLITL